MGNLPMRIVSKAEADYYLVSVIFFTQPIKKQDVQSSRSLAKGG